MATPSGGRHGTAHAAWATSTPASTVKPSVPKSPLAGFDTCTAPSQNAMKAWKSKYSAIGIYIGGQNMASSNWFQTESSWQISDSFSYTHGAHNIVAGLDLRRRAN